MRFLLKLKIRFYARVNILVNVMLLTVHFYLLKEKSFELLYSVK